MDLTVWGTGAVPKEHPLQALVPLKLVFEAELIFFISKLEQI